MIFKGSGVAIVTPFKEDYSVDYEAYERLLDFQLENGTDAIIACGTTSEATTLTKEEKLKIIDLTIEKVGGKVPVIVGTGSNNTKEAANFSREVSQIEGVDGLLVVTPYYNKATGEGLFLHFKTIAEASEKPIILYNVPGRTKVQIHPETVGRLAKLPKVAGIKDAGADLKYTATVKSLVPEDFAIYSGSDEVTVPLLSVGGSGVISVLANIFPGEVHEMVASYLGGDVEKAGRMQVSFIKIIDHLFREVNPTPIKTALSLLGFCGPTMRLPLTEATEETRKLLAEDLREFGKEVK